MRKLIALGLVLLGFTVALSVSNRKGRAADNEAEIRQALQRWAKEFRTHDVDGIMAMYEPDVVAYDILAALQYVGKDAYRKDYIEFLAQFDGPVDVEFRDSKVTVGDTVGFVYTLEHFSGKMKNGEPLDLWGRCTSGFRKINGKWMDVH